MLTGQWKSPKVSDPGYRHLLACIERHGSRSPQELLDALLAAVRAFCGKPSRSDDVTIVMMRYDGRG